MSSDYIELTLSDVAFISSGKRPPTVSKERGPDVLVPVMGGGGQSGFTSQSLTMEPVLITGRVGTLGKLHVSHEPVWPSDNALVIRPRREVVSFDYLRYALGGVIHLAIGMNRGAANPLVTQSDLGKLPIPVPDAKEQNKIATVLTSLDDRISLLRETNATLEAIAQAIFKSWFVDFDPVRAKQEGRAPEGMDEATAALFPDSFEESTMGLVPRGWKVKSLDAVASFLNGLALQKYPPTGHNDLPVIKIAQLRKGDTTGADLASRSIKPEYVVHNGDVLFSWSGSLEVEIWCGGDGALNQHLFKVLSNDFSKWFYFLWTRHHLEHFRQVAVSKATTMGHIQRGHLTAAKVLVPSEEVLRAADEVLEPIIHRVIENSLQANNLAALRDALLPRLISGQLRLPEAEGAIAEVAA
jgi:type I restriction enzyme S subunit